MSTQSKLARISQAQCIHWVVYLVIAGLIFFFLSGSKTVLVFSSDPAIQRSFGSLVAQLAGGFASVTITALAIVFALPDRPILNDMRESGHFLDLCAWLASAILAFLILTAIASFVSALERPQILFNVLLSSLIPVGLIALQTGLRIALTLVAVARPLD